ncbi:MAG: hypothetical protein ACLP50_35800 [Solirubrobacteraceae bacterium]
MARSAARIGIAFDARRRLVPALAVVVLIAVTAPALARADGDPASDVLLGQNVFYPYVPQVSGALQRRLNDEAAAAHTAGFPLKVALIGSPVDLGSIPSLFGRPQQYADFLDTEISFEGRQPVLVVMAAGYGLQGAPAAAARALSTLPRPTGAGNDALARAAVTAIGRLAAAVGHPIAGAAAAPAGSTQPASGSKLVVLLVLVAGAVCTAGVLLALRTRKRWPRGRAARAPRRRGS